MEDKTLLWGKKSITLTYHELADVWAWEYIRLWVDKQDTLSDLWCASVEYGEASIFAEASSPLTVMDDLWEDMQKFKTFCDDVCKDGQG